jgi:protein-tyrosine sulfotransferase
MLPRSDTNNSSLARWLRRRGSRHVSTQSPVIVGGCQRSGTTLLRVMLDSHSRIACGPESSLLAGSYLPEVLARKFDIALPEIVALRRQAHDHAEFIELFFAKYLTLRGKERWSEKTPRNVRYVEYLWKHFPQAKFIHVIRDGRDVVCSLRTHPRHRLVNGERVPTGIRRSLAPCINVWLRDTAAGIRWRGHTQYHEVRYEDLLTQSEQTLRRICDFIGEKFEAGMLEYHRNGGASRDPNKFISNVAATQPLSDHAVARWRRDLTGDELALVEKMTRDRMRELGYTPVHS